MTVQLEKSAISPTLVGRADQLAALARRLEQARGGLGQAVLVTGEAGIGKTRLLAECQAQAAGLGFAVLQGRCMQLDTGLPYAPLVDLLRGYLAQQPTAALARDLGPLASELAVLLPELPALLAAPAPLPLLNPDKYRLFHALERLLFTLAAQAPLLVVVEDIHWSDDASLDFLLHLAQRLADQPVLLLLTYRAEDERPSLAQFLLASNRGRLADELGLRPLTPAQVEVMLRAIFEQQRLVSAEFLEVVCALTEGNPFFIEEVLNSLLTAGDIFMQDGAWHRKPVPQLRIPHSLQVAVKQRTAAFSSDTRHLMELAAVTGRRFNFGLLQDLTGLAEPVLLQHLKQLLAAQIIVEETGEDYAFRHALTREAVYSSLLLRERQQHHRRLAEILERRPGPAGSRVAELAHHYYQGGEWEKALAYTQQAGDRARAMHAPREAAAFYTRALEAAEHLGRLPSAELCRARGQAHETIGEFEQARADYERALPLAQKLADRRAEWQCLVDLGFLWAAQDYVRAGGYFRQALELARAQDDPLLLAHSLNRLGNWHANLDQPQEALQYHSEALAIFDTLGDRPGRAETLDLLGIASAMAGDLTASLGHYQQAVGLFEELDDRRGLASSLAVMGESCSSYLMDAVAAAPLTLTAAAAHASRALEIARQIGWRSGEAYALVVLSICSGSLGRQEQAQEQARGALELAAEIDHHQWMAYAHIAHGLAYQSVLAFAAAVEHFAQALALARDINSPYWIGVAAGLLASSFVHTNELEQAATLVDPGEGVQTPLHTFTQKLAAAARVELYLSEGNLAAAQAESSRLLTVVLPPELHADHALLSAPRLLKLHGDVLAAHKRFPEAVALFQQALTAAQAQGARPLEWRLHAALGSAWRAQRRFDAAEAAFAQARSLIETLAEQAVGGEPRASFLATGLSQLPGQRPGSSRRAAKREFGGLTERERHIAGLVAQGRSNREIALALVLSERTVEKHVSNILGKLQVETRAQLIAWAHRKGLLTSPD